MDTGIHDFINDVKNSHQKDSLRRLPFQKIILKKIFENPLAFNFIIINKYNDFYTVSINKSSKDFTCTCQDHLFRSYRLCKHISFVICNVLNLYDATVFNNKKITSTQLEYCKNKIKLIDNIIYNFDIDHPVNDDDTCLICLELLFKNKLLKCPKCKCIIHKQCMDMWFNQTKNKSCIYCRSSVWKNYHENDLCLL